MAGLTAHHCNCRSIALPGTLAVIAAHLLHLDIFGNFHLTYSAISTAILAAAPLCFARELLSMPSGVIG